MRILIGDTQINQRFLTVAARRAGFTEIVGAATAEDLFERSAAADVIAFDPAIRAADAIDVTLHLVRLAPLTPLIVMSSRTTDLDRAERHAIVSVRKRSFLELDPIEAAMTMVRDLVAVEQLAERTSSSVFPLELFAAPGGEGPMPIGSSPRTGVLAACLGAA